MTYVHFVGEDIVFSAQHGAAATRDLVTDVGDMLRRHCHLRSSYSVISVTKNRWLSINV